MQPNEIKTLIEAGLPHTEAFLEGDGSHFTAIIVSPAFEQLSRVKRQQLVYATVKEQLLDGRLHALSLKTYTPEEWQALNQKKETQ
jgi:acid stress-induced BolA-like protein IbaG/YrbA